jgi:dUTP pyrophosphatase
MKLNTYKIIYKDGKEVIVKAKSTQLIDLELSCEMKKISTKFTANSQSFFVNKSFLLVPRSSISKTPLRMANSIGIIDAGYRGSLKVVVDNISENDFVIKEGTKLFQICSPNLEEINVILTDTLSNTERGTGGFGSSNK